MDSSQRVTVMRSLAGVMVFTLCVSSAWAGEPQNSQGPMRPAVLIAQNAASVSGVGPGLSETNELPSGGMSVEDLLLQKGQITMDEWIQIRAEQEYKSADQVKRIDAIEDWKSKTELLPMLRDKVNFGLNALQFLYTRNEAHVAEGKSQDNLSIRRSEVLFWGKISDTIPRWHALMEFQSINLTSNTPNTAGATGAASSSTFFRESYIDFRPIQSWAPNLNYFRVGIFRMPFGIFTETSGGLRDIISSPYLTSVGGAGGPGQNNRGTGGQIEFLQERDFFADVRGKIANRLEYVAGIMNNNNYQANSTGANSPKSFYSRVRLFGTDVSFISFTTIQGESNNANTNINGRGKGAFDRYGIDARYTSKLLPGFMMQGEWWQGHDGANATTVGIGANGACQNTIQCGGSGAPGMQRRTYYVLAKYLITEGMFQNFEPTVMWEQFDPNTSMSNDMYTRTIAGLTYYFENFPPKVQSKLQLNYEFRHHQGFGPGTSVPNNDPFAQNTFLIQFQVRFM